MNYGNSPDDSLELSRNKPFRPSKLAVLFECPWQYLLSTEHPKTSMLGLNPIGVLGSSMHKIIEKNAGEHHFKGLEVQQLIQEEFKKQITKLPNNFLKWTFQKYGMNGVINPARLLSAAQLAFKSIRSSPQKTNILQYFPSNSEESKSNFIRESKFFSLDLDLEGWPDLVYKNENSVHVVDYKLSLSRSEDGSPKESYILQAAAYGLLAKELNRNSDVILELTSPSDNWARSLDKVLENKVKETLTSASTILPKGKSFQILQLARLGNHCTKCNFRPSCSAYTNNLLSISSDQGDSISKNDVVGNIISINQIKNTIRIELETNLLNRKVTIEGLVPEIHSNLKIGDFLFGYELSTSEIKGRGTYVANFHILNSATPHSSAFSSFIKT